MITVKQLKDWLGKFPDYEEVEYRMDCFYGLSYLIIPYEPTPSKTKLELFNLDTGEVKKEEVDFFDQN